MNKKLIQIRELLFDLPMREHGTRVAELIEEDAGIFLDSLYLAFDTAEEEKKLAQLDQAIEASRKIEIEHQGYQDVEFRALRVISRQRTSAEARQDFLKRLAACPVGKGFKLPEGVVYGSIYGFAESIGMRARLQRVDGVYWVQRLS
jgi:hypothetical protein